MIHELLDEIEEQAPSFRLMMANIQVMINLETPDAPVERYPVEPPAVVSRIVERYAGQAVEQGKDIAWWSEPEDFGLVYSDATALEHIIANLVDNALRYGGDYIEITVTRDTDTFQVRVTDDGPGIPAQYRGHLFTRGWTPEMGRSQEKTSSGLGLYHQPHSGPPLWRRPVRSVSDGAGGRAAHHLYPHPAGGRARRLAPVRDTDRQSVPHDGLSRFAPTDTSSPGVPVGRSVSGGVGAGAPRHAEHAFPGQSETDPAAANGRTHPAGSHPAAGDAYPPYPRQPPRQRRLLCLPPPLPPP